MTGRFRCLARSLGLRDSRSIQSCSPYVLSESVRFCTALALISNLRRHPTYDGGSKCILMACPAASNTVGHHCKLTAWLVAFDTRDPQVPEELLAVAAGIFSRLELQSGRAASLLLRTFELGIRTKVLAIRIFVLCQFAEAKALHMRSEVFGHGREREENMRFCFEEVAFLELAGAEFWVVVENAV